MNKEQLAQSAVYAAAEAKRLSFSDRLRKRSDQSFLKRLGKAAAGNLFKALLDVPTTIEKDGRRYDLLGNGFENLIYADESSVLKFNVRTLTVNQAQAEAEAVRQEHDFDLCKSYLGDHWLDTTFRVSDFMGRYVVEARQRFVVPVRKFSMVEEMLIYRDDPEYNQQLEDLFVAIGNLYQNTGYYPDILGANNLALIESIFGDQTIVILDTGVASTEHQQNMVPNQNIRIKDAITERLSLWEAHLAGPRSLSEFREPALR